MEFAACPIEADEGLMVLYDLAKMFHPENFFTVEDSRLELRLQAFHKRGWPHAFIWSKLSNLCHFRDESVG